MKKKISCVLLVITLIAGQLYAVDFSWGGSFAFGMPIFRGENAKNMIDSVENYDDVADTFLLKLVGVAPSMQTDLLIGISPYFALETGVGMRWFGKGWKGANRSVAITSMDLMIPLMARGRYDIGILSLYASIGPTFIIPLPIYDYYYDKVTGFPATDVETNPFLMDLGFALGFEVKLGKFHMGLRGSYDLNVISPIKTINGRDVKWYQDNLNLSITFRDAVKS